MAIKPNGTYALSFTTSSQVADPDNSLYQRIDLDSPPTQINGVVDVVGNVGRTLGFTFGGGITAEVDDPIIASGVNEAYTEWTDSGRWIIDDTNAWFEFTGLPPNSWCAFQWRAWKQQAVGYEQILLNGAQHSYTHSSTSATNRNEQHRLVWIGADGKLRVEINVDTGETAPLSAIQISTRESLQGDTEYIGLFMMPYSGGVSSVDFITHNSLSFPEMQASDPSAVGQDLTLNEGRTVLHDAFDNPTPYVIETVKDIWQHGASGMGGISYGGLYTGSLSGFALARYADGKSAFKIKNLPVGKRYRYFVTGENSNERDTDFWVNGEFQRYDASSLTTSTEIQTAVSHMLKFEGIVPASGELLVEWDARADTASTTYYGYHGHAYLMLDNDVLLGEADFDQFTVQDYAIGAAGDTFYKDYTPLSSGTANGFNIKIDEFFTCDGFKLLIADASGNHLGISDEVLPSVGDNQTLYVPLQSSVELVAGTTYRLGISLKDSNAGYLRLFGDDNASSWKWYRIDNGGYSTVPTLTGGVESAAGFLPIQVVGEAKKVRSHAPQIFYSADLTGLWSGSNFYHEFDLTVAPDTNCLVVRMAGSINSMQGVSLDGVAFTKVFSDSDNNSAGIEVWYLMNPPTGTNTLRVDAGASGFQRNYLFNELSGVDVGFVPVYQSERGWKSTRTTTVNGGDGAYVLSVATWQDTQSLDYDNTSGVTEVDDVVSRSGYLFEAYSQNQVGSGDLTISASQTANQGVIGTVAFAFDSGGTGSVQVENSFGSLWNIYQQATGSLEARWSLLQAVQNSTSIDWNILQEALASTSLDWNIIQSAIGSTAIEWNLSGKVISELGLDWNLLQAATRSFGLDWNVLREAKTGVELKFNLLNQASQSLGVEYDIKAEVNQSFLLSWNNDGTLGRVSRSLSLSWNIFEGVNATLAANWNLLQSVGASLEIRNDIAQQVSNAIEVGFDIKNSVEGLLSVTWDSIARVNGNIELSWKIELDGLVLPVHQMIVLEENRVMTVLGENRIMTIK